MTRLSRRVRAGFHGSGEQFEFGGRGINAASEAFNSVLKIENAHRHTFATRTEARLRIATWITGFYNTHRLHSVCWYHSPIDYERDHQADPAVELAA
ncbi:IS3 family transposase [Streptomyces violascens]|uniref:IS3 family transposase n=1 Tax=Streptomyces violascens TaxID=67381 RepID=UPI0036978494